MQWTSAAAATASARPSSSSSSPSPSTSSLRSHAMSTATFSGGWRRSGWYRNWLADVATYPLLGAVIFGGCVLTATIIRKTSGALDQRNVDLTIEEAELLNRLRAAERDAGAGSSSTVQPASPVRSAAAALLFNPHHAPAPVPPPPHLSGEESDEAHEGRAGRLSFAQGERPSQAAMFPLPSLLLGGLVDTGRDVLSLLFPRLFGELRAVEVEVEEGVTAVTREPIALTKTTSLTPRTSALPSCCQSSYRALFMSLLMPFLPLAAEACTVPTASKVHEQGTPLSLSPARPSLTGSIPLSAAPWPSPAVIHPELHPEVLFDCPDEGAVADWGGAHRNDGEDDGEQYFVRIYERFLAMAEGAGPEMLE